MIEIEMEIDMPHTLARLDEAFDAAELKVAVQIMKDARSFVPARSMTLANSAHVIGNHIIYPGKYARYVYMGKAMVDSETGRGPFYIDGVGYRFRKGAHLVATDRNLQYSTSPHPKATSHWMEAAKEEHMEKWKRVIKKAVSEVVGKT